MTLRFMDSFDHYDTAHILRKWNAIGGATPAISTANPRNGTQHLRVTDDDDYLSKTLDDQASWIVGFGFQIDALPDANSIGILGFMDTGTIFQAQLLLNNDGTLEVIRGGVVGNATSRSTVTGGKSSLSISGGTYYFIEMKVTVADSIGAGTCVVKVNGTTYITVATGQDLKTTANATANQIFIGSMGGDNRTTDHDDLYICDGTGSAPQNDFLGDCRVEALFPDGEGAVNQFTGSDADTTNNHLHVDETSPDDDTTYVENATAGNQDLYTFGDLSAAPGTIFGVQSNIMAKKDDAGSRSAMALTRSGSTIYDGDTNALTEGSYEVHRHIDEQDPDTAAAWTEAGVNAAQFGVETV